MLRASDGAITELFGAEAIALRVEAIAAEMARAGLENLLIVIVLKGGFIFAADLLRALYRHGLEPEVEFMLLASYGDKAVSSGAVTMLRDVDCELAGRDVVIVDDILDTGRTLAFAKASLAARGARRVLACVLLDKMVPRAVPIEPEFRGFACPDKFVVGYGMDLGGRYRELPFIGTLRTGAKPTMRPR